MKESHRAALGRDYAEGERSWPSLLIDFKLLVYSWQKPLLNFFLKLYLKKELGRESIFHLFDHLLLSQKEYDKRFTARFSLKEQNFDSTEAKDMKEHDLFSRLKAQEYLDILESVGFKKKQLFAKVYTQALWILRQNSAIRDRLDKIKAPLFDRVCGGFYLWMSK